MAPDETNEVETNKTTKEVAVERNWIDDQKYHHRKVYTAKGVGIIQAVAWCTDAVPDGDPDRALIEVMETAEQFDLSFKSLRFKAIDDEYRERYIVDKGVKTASGAPSVSNGDEIAEALKGLSIEELGAIAVENGLSHKWEAWRAKNLNLGMRRMNLGNMLRNKAKHGDEIVFFGKPVAEHMTIHGKELAEKAAAESSAKEAAKAAKETARKEKREAEAAAKAEAKAERDAAKEAAKEASVPKSKRKKKVKEETSETAETAA